LGGWLRPVFFFILLAVLSLPSLATARAPREHRVTELASTTPAGAADAGLCQSEHHNICPKLAVTADGRHVFFTLGHTSPLYEHFAGRTVPVSVGPLGVGNISGNCYRFNLPSNCDYEVSEDGRSVAFSTGDSLVPEDTGGWDVYVRSRGVTRLVSTDEPEAEEYGSLTALVEAMSADGSRVFYRRAGYAKSSPLYEWSSTGVSEFPAEDAWVYKSGASDDGRRVFFETATPLVPEDDNTLVDVYERTWRGQIELVSADASGHARGGYFNSASSDGQRAIFSTDAPLTPDDTDQEGDIYVRERGITTLLTPNTFSGLVAPIPGHSAWAAVYFLAASADARRVLFESDEPLAAADADNGRVDVYERANGQTTLITTSALGPNGPFDARFAYPNGISSDATHVFFETDERFLAEDTDSCHIYTDTPDGCPDLYERVGDRLRLVTTGSGSHADERSASFLGVSADGARVIFGSSEPLVSEDRDSCSADASVTAGCPDIYERHNGTITLVSTGPTDSQGVCGRDGTLPTCPGFVGMSSDGRSVYFRTSASLTREDVDGGLEDLYVSRVAPLRHEAKRHHQRPRRHRR
jgi:hypothetical protein